MKTVSALALLLWVAQLRGCAIQKIKKTGKENEMTPKTVEEVLKENTSRLMAVPGVVGVAQGELNGQPSVMVFVVKKSAELKGQIPESLDGYPVVIQETGEFKALDSR